MKSVQHSDLKRVKQIAMNGYYSVLTTIDLFVLSFMGLLTRLSESLNKKQKRGFFLAFALIAGISVMEIVTLAVDGAPAKYRWLNIASNFLGFGLSPAVAICRIENPHPDRIFGLRWAAKLPICCFLHSPFPLERCFP